MLLGLLGLVFDSRKAAPGDENLCRYFGPPNYALDYLHGDPRDSKTPLLKQ